MSNAHKKRHSKFIKLQEISNNSRYPIEIQAQRLQKVIDNELTETQRRDVVEYFFNDKTLQEIASTTGRNRTTVYRVIQRALVRITRCLKY